MQDCGGFSSAEYHSVGLSGGKDSSALLLLMLEKGMPIDSVIFADTGMDFPEMAAHIAKLDALLYHERGIHITTLRHPHGFTFLCMVAAAISRQFISQDGYIGGFNLRLAAQLAMSGIGVVLAVRWVLELKNEHHSCHGCHDCGKLERKAGVLPMLCAGLIYSFTPCAPLLLMIGDSFTLPVPLAGATGVAFSLASMASPVLLLTVITGALSRKMRQEIPGCIKWFRLGSYLLLIVMPFVITI